jgi:hypothetical protein
MAVPALGERLEAEHRGKRQPAGSYLSSEHPHPPVLARQLRFADRTALMVEREKDDAVLHEMPSRRRLRWRGMLVLSESGRREQD